MNVPSLIAGAALVTGATLGFTFTPQDARSADSLRDAVQEFNAKAINDPIGKDQPALTEDEVVASIRGWIRAHTPGVSDEVYDEFQKVAETGKLPKGAKLTSTTSWLGYRGFHFDVWWVDLTISTGEKTGYTFRIRDQKIRSRPVNQQQREFLEREEKRVSETKKGK